MWILDRAANVTARKQFLAGEVNAAASSMASFERGSVLSAMLGDKAHSDEYLARFEAGAGELAKGLGSLHHIAESPENQRCCVESTVKRRKAYAMDAHVEFRRAMTLTPADGCRTRGIRPEVAAAT